MVSQAGFWDDDGQSTTQCKKCDADGSGTEICRGGAAVPVTCEKGGQWVWDDATTDGERKGRRRLAVVRPPLRAYMRCKSCQGGTHCPGGLMPKRNCDRGQSDHDADTSTACTECDPGHISRSTHSGKCIPCAPGTYELEHLFCVPCADGHYSGSAADHCKPCDAGKHAVVSRECQACPAGKVAGVATAPTKEVLVLGQGENCTSAGLTAFPSARACWPVHGLHT